ncbi:MAG: thiamine-phosphate kinase [Verrucomicrobia bacterium]|nr:thiamine-phosphate kinase [Verrucomicrobiota bacterium]
MTLADVGEDRAVSLLTKALPHDDAHVLVRAGDDCAVVRHGAELLLLKTDCVVEEVHFTRTASPAAVGWKALCRAISDVAAMGGRPADGLITLAVPGSLSLSWVRRLYTGLRRAAVTYGVNLVGGETARSPSGIFISVALTGLLPTGRYVTRAGGQPGDWVFVTGRLGGSLAGHHLRFRPRVEEAIWLTQNFSIHAMMDLSDGLTRDLPRMARASGVGFRIDRAALPLNRGCTVDQGLGDGEDYELLFTVAGEEGARVAAAWPEAFPKVRLSRVGELTQARGHAERASGGFDHFRR